MARPVLLVNFGGPRDLNEVEEFLCTLLTDRDVIRSSLPSFLHNYLFTKIAKKRTFKVKEDYTLIGKKSPIFEDTEEIAVLLAEKIGCEVIPFHRYLPKTHASFFKKMEKLKKECLVFPLFPQFSYATTGSIARFFSKHLRQSSEFLWIKSYCAHPAYIQVMITTLSAYLKEKQIKEEEALLFFSPHGLPIHFIKTGDIYEKECRLSFEKISAAFPKALHLMAYQSKFGKGEWLRPYTDETCRAILSFNQNRQHVVFVPLSFTSDHVETLFEVEQQYLPLIREQGLHAYRCPALNRHPAWIDAIAHILQDTNFSTTKMLIYG